MRSLLEVVLKLNEVLILVTLQGSLDYALIMQISKRLSRITRSIAYAVF